MHDLPYGEATGMSIGANIQFIILSGTLLTQSGGTKRSGQYCLIISASLAFAELR